MSDDITGEVARLKAKGIECSPISDEGRGSLTTLRLPGGGDLGLYQPRHLVHGAGR